MNYSFPRLPEEEDVQAPGTGLPSHELQVLRGHEGPIFAVRWNRQGTYCVSCGKVRA